MVEDTVMTPWNPRWPEFFDELVGSDWDKREAVRCKGVLMLADGTFNKESLAIKILEDMNMDLKASVAFWVSHGGHCDCEVIYNVEIMCEDEKTDLID